MWVRRVILVIALVCLARASNYSVFTQMVDPFNPLLGQTYQQRYYLSDDGLPAAAPTFFFLGGEAPIEFFEFQEVSARQWAKDLGARYIALEHRYYGHSNPSSDLETENMIYLSSQYALADAANFVSTFQQKYSGPWIVFGCSYSGSLSAWFRSKYPNLVVGSIAPSGPVLAKYDFTDFLANFGNVAPPACVTATKSAVAQINKLFKTSDGRAKLESYFNSCGSIENDEIMFKWTISEMLAGTAQWNNPPDFPMASTCQALVQASDVVKEWGNQFASQSTTCTDFSLEAFIQPIQNTALGNDDRAWYWQKCTEFAFFQGSHDNSSIFFNGIDSTFLGSFCSLIFGVELQPHVGFTNAYYGGMDVQGTQIMFTNGQQDPWHTLSINQSTKPGVYASTYAAGHCAPMTAPTSSDPQSLRDTRVAVKKFLQSLLAEKLDH